MPSPASAGALERIERYRVAERGFGAGGIVGGQKGHAETGMCRRPIRRHRCRGGESTGGFGGVALAQQRMAQVEPGFDHRRVQLDRAPVGSGGGFKPSLVTAGDAVFQHDIGIAGPGLRQGGEGFGRQIPVLRLDADLTDHL